VKSKKELQSLKDEVKRQKAVTDEGFSDKEARRVFLSALDRNESKENARKMASKVQMQNKDISGEFNQAKFDKLVSPVKRLFSGKAKGSAPAPKAAPKASRKVSPQNDTNAFSRRKWS